jgi:hypothetical protein
MNRMAAVEEEEEEEIILVLVALVEPVGYMAAVERVVAVE